jgi:hypothetical protein
MKIWELGGLLLVREKSEVNHLYLLHLKLMQSRCFVVCGRGNEVVWHLHERFWHINMAALLMLAQDVVVHGIPVIG